MNLTPEERKAVFAGRLKVLRRPQKPDQEAGTEMVVSWSRGGKHIVDRSTGATVDIPRQPRLWIVVKGWHLKQGEKEWQTDVVIHDVRETNRELSGGIGGMPREAGLKTRWGTTVIHRDGAINVRPKRVPTKDEQRENWTPETERGYGGSAGRGLDQRSAEGQYVPATAVDDATIRDFLKPKDEGGGGIEAANIGHRTKQRKRERQMGEEMKMAREYRKGNGSGARAAERRKLRAERGLDVIMGDSGETVTIAA